MHACKARERRNGKHVPTFYGPKTCLELDTKKLQQISGMPSLPSVPFFVAKQKFRLFLASSVHHEM
jgi:hypothetical protein